MWCWCCFWLVGSHLSPAERGFFVEMLRDPFTGEQVSVEALFDDHARGRDLAEMAARFGVSPMLLRRRFQRIQRLRQFGSPNPPDVSDVRPRQRSGVDPETGLLA